MRIIIDASVHEAIADFYRYAMDNHLSLTYETVEAKKDRLYDAINSLRYYYRIYPMARLKREWIEKGWHEFICEDFHFAYAYGRDMYGEMVIYVYDAIHSLSYR